MVRGSEVNHLAPDSVGRSPLSTKWVTVEVIDDTEQLPGTIDAVVAARTGTVDPAGPEEAPQALEQRPIRLGESDREDEQQLLAAPTESKAAGALREPRHIPGVDFFTGKCIKCFHRNIISCVPRGTLW